MNKDELIAQSRHLRRQSRGLIERSRKLKEECNELLQRNLERSYTAFLRSEMGRKFLRGSSTKVYNVTW